MSKTTTFSSSNNTLDNDTRSNYITKLEHAFIIFILKKLSNENFPLSASTIAEYMSLLTGENHCEKTILKKIKALYALQSDSGDPVFGNTLLLTFGGTIVEVSNEGKKNITKKQSKYYFKPLMYKSDLELICGSISSNRYLSDAEKSYLISREMTLSSLNANSNTLTKQIDESTQTTLASDYLDKPQTMLL